MIKEHERVLPSLSAKVTSSFVQVHQLLQDKPSYVSPKPDKLQLLDIRYCAEIVQPPSHPPLDGDKCLQPLHRPISFGTQPGLLGD